jgi:hypothetical protein
MNWSLITLAEGKRLGTKQGENSEISDQFRHKALEQSLPFLDDNDNHLAELYVDCCMRGARC